MKNYTFLLGLLFTVYTSVFGDRPLQQWAAHYNGPGDSWDGARALIVDNSGNVYVTGYDYGIGTSDYATIKYKQLSCTSPINGDLNKECRVDYEDLAIMVSQWFECNYLPEENC